MSERERRRRDNAKRAAAKRAWEHAHDRRACAVCGEPMGVGVHRRGVTRCLDCWHTQQREAIAARDEWISDMWLAGLTMRELADRLGWSMGHLAVEMARIRDRAPELLPYRYKNTKRQRAAA